MAALHRHARRARGPTRRRSASASSRPSPTSSTRPAGCCWSSDGGGAIDRGRRVELAGRQPARAPSSRRERRLLERGRSRRPDPRVRRAARRLGRRRDDQALPMPAVDARRTPRLGRHSADPPRPAGRRSSCSPRPTIAAPLDWEDFDLLRTAGRQAASSLAEAHGQEALANAQRFEEFNRRFAFILHDIKNLVSQLSLRRAQCRAACRQSRVPRRHGRDAARARSAR